MLEREEGRAFHRQVLDGFVLCRAEEPGCVVAVDQIEVGADVGFLITPYEVERIIVQTDIEKIFSEATCMDEGYGVVGSQRTIAERCMFVCSLYHSLPVIVEHLHLHPCDGSHVGMA